MHNDLLDYYLKLNNYLVSLKNDLVNYTVNNIESEIILQYISDNIFLVHQQIDYLKMNENQHK